MQGWNVIDFETDTVFTHADYDLSVAEVASYMRVCMNSSA